MGQVAQRQNLSTKTLLKRLNYPGINRLHWESMTTYPKCISCPTYDSEQCKSCYWLTEIKLIVKYGWPEARYTMYQEFKESKAQMDPKDTPY